MDSLEDLGRKAYQKQMWGDFDGAITIYTTAIKKYPKDNRLINNRCLCYIENKDYKRALEDAESMIRLFPGHIKSHFRKGEVLTYLQRYAEAENCFRKALSIDPSCEEAQEQLTEVQIAILTKKGCTKSQAQKALHLTDNNVQEAEYLIRFGGVPENDTDFSEIYISDEEEFNVETEYDPFMDPSNPFHSTSLWVGFLSDKGSENISEDVLHKAFSKYGRIKSILVYHARRCAFVNYFDSTGPGKAMKALQGATLGDKSVIIKYPDNVLSNGITVNGNSSKRSKPN